MAASDYFEIQVDTTREIVRIIRTEQRMPDGADEVKRVYAELAPELAPYAGYRALLDVRRVPIGRNDAGFERQAVRAQTALAKTFVRSAVLVRSAAGKLQAKRMTGGAAHVFQNEAEAIRYLTEK